MCNDCFPAEISRFPSYRDYDNFENSLNARVRLGYLQIIDRSDSYTKYDNVTAVYQCSSCGTEWYFSKPHMQWRGFFLTYRSFQALQPELQEKGKRYPVLTWIMLILFLIFIIARFLK